MESINFKGEQVFLRLLEPTDLPVLHQVENNPEFWTISQTVQPFTQYTLSQYIAQAHQDIYESKQQRWVICNHLSQCAIGFIDLFDFDVRNSRVGMGIVIAKKENRNQGYATEALRILIDYCKKHLYVRQIFVNILTDNTASIQLFSKFGFELAGVKKQWIRQGMQFKDEAFYQLIFKDL